MGSTTAPAHGTAVGPLSRRAPSGHSARSALQFFLLDAAPGASGPPFRLLFFSLQQSASTSVKSFRQSSCAFSGSDSSSSRPGDTFLGHSAPCGFPSRTGRSVAMKNRRKFSRREAHSGDRPTGMGPDRRTPKTGGLAPMRVWGMSASGADVPLSIAMVIGLV